MNTSYVTYCQLLVKWNNLSEFFLYFYRAVVIGNSFGLHTSVGKKYLSYSYDSGEPIIINKTTDSYKLIAFKCRSKLILVYILCEVKPDGGFISG